MSNFPLYDNLRQSLPKRDLTAKQKAEFVSKVSNINPTGAELVYALIRVHQIQESGEAATLKLPYGGTYSNTDITFDLAAFPIALRQILYRFVNIHLKSMEEDSFLSDFRV